MYELAKKKYITLKRTVSFDFTPRRSASPSADGDSALGSPICQHRSRLSDAGCSRRTHNHRRRRLYTSFSYPSLPWLCLMPYAYPFSTFSGAEPLREHAFFINLDVSPSSLMHQYAIAVGRRAPSRPSRYGCT